MTPPHRDANYYVAKRRKRRRWPWVLLASVWLLVGGALGALLSAADLLNDTVKGTQAPAVELNQAKKVLDRQLPGKPLNILLIGSDKRSGRQGTGDVGRADSLILVRMDFRNNFISMLSFPRDLYVQIPGYGQDKINAAYSFGERRRAGGGPAKTIETIKALTGQNINAYVNIDFVGFQRLVDAVGGVFLDVDRRYYNKNSVGCRASCFAEIDLQPGYQRLNGRDALAFARYRHTDSDQVRGARQQLFLSELKRQTARFGNVTQVRRLVRIISGNFKTSLGSKVIDVLQLGIAVDKSRINRVGIQGRSSATSGGASIVVADQTEIQQATDDWLNPQFQVSTPVRAVNPATVRVAVLNGNGRLLGAEAAAQALVARGYDAYAVGNAPNFAYRGTSVFYAPDRYNAAKAVQALFGPSTGIAPRSRDQVNKLTRESDVIVVAGSDFTTLRTAPRRTASLDRPDVVPTLSLVPALSAIPQSSTGLRVLVPTKVARESRVRIVRRYVVNGINRPAVKIVFERIGPKYWSIEEMRWKRPTFFDGATARNYRRRGCPLKFWTFYDGKKMQRLAWQSGEMSYWISNSLTYVLSPETMYAIACSMQPPRTAKLPKGVKAATIRVNTNDLTP
ncbi:MAG: LCP family protein [Actinobacteria bacterium]|nr:LCP family protein [Actinomycetota bacterium]